MGERRVTLNALVMPTTQAVVDYVADHRLAVGYATRDAVDSRVRVVPVEGLAPGQLAPLEGYHLVRTLSLAARNPHPQAVAEFLAFADSGAGLEIWKKHFMPIR
jgi:hypothetical protein